jgi:hypothetical protein
MYTWKVNGSLPIELGSSIDRVKNDPYTRYYYSGQYLKLKKARAKCILENFKTLPFSSTGAGKSSSAM